MKDRIRTNIENRNQPEMRRNASTHKLLPENEFEDFKEWSLIFVTFEDRPLLGTTTFKDTAIILKFTSNYIFSIEDTMENFHHITIYVKFKMTMSSLLEKGNSLIIKAAFKSDHDILNRKFMKSDKPHKDSCIFR